MSFKLSTKIEVKPIGIGEIGSAPFLIGSCFSDAFSGQLQRIGLPCDVNPFGTVYHPLALAKQLEPLLSASKWSENDLHKEGDRYYFLNGNTEYQSDSLEILLSKLRERTESSHHTLKNSKCLIITLGTSFAYRLLDSGEVVANCHKLPTNRFERELIDHTSWTEVLAEQLSTYLSAAPDRDIILTVSPVRHLRDAAVENSISKSQLILGAHSICSKLQRVHYFPSYEILLDELRDYRFYDSDLVHPSSLAQEIIFSRFTEFFYKPSESVHLAELEKYSKRKNHRLDDPHSEQAALFLKQNEEMKSKLLQKFPFLEL